VDAHLISWPKRVDLQIFGYPTVCARVRLVINGTAKHGRETFAGTEQIDVPADKTDVEIVKRKKKLSKKLYGTSHVVSKDQAKFVFEKRGRTEADVLRQQELPSCYSTDVAGYSWLQ
jgi:hypothetical protein